MGRRSRTQRDEDTESSQRHSQQGDSSKGYTSPYDHVESRSTSGTQYSGPSHDYDSDEIPDDIHRRNSVSVQRSLATAYEDGPAGETGVPESVRRVVASSGQALDSDIQRAMEDRMGDSFADVQVHTGPQAAAACESINARAFTVGNNIAFNSGEYDPSSLEGQHVLAHELAHVRQQTGGAVSMLPQEDVELEIDPDPELEREAEQTAQRVMTGGELGIQRLRGTEVHVQRFKINEEAGESVIAQYREAIMDNTELDEGDLAQIEAEVGLNISNTDYSGGEIHDALNQKLLTKAESVLDEAGQKIRELRGLDGEAEAAIGSVDGVEATESFQDDLEWYAEAEMMLEDLASEDGLDPADEKMTEIAEQRSEMEDDISEVRSILESVDAELQQLLGEENIRLTPEQQSDVEKAITEVADIAGGTVTGVVLNYLVGTGFDKTLVDLYEQVLANKPEAMAAGSVTVSVVYKGLKIAGNYILGGGENPENIIDVDSEGTDEAKFN